MNINILCVICMRGGSKRLPGKHLRKYGGKTLIQHALEKATESKYIDKVIVGTEDKEIIEYVKSLKLKPSPDIEIYELTKEMTKANVSMYLSVTKILEEYPDYGLIVILQADNPVEEGMIDRCIDKYFEMEKKIREEKKGVDDNLFFEDVITVHDNRLTGTVRVISRDAFLSPFPTSKIYIMQDRDDFVDIHTEEDLKKANDNLRDDNLETFPVATWMKEPYEENTLRIYNHFRRYDAAVKCLKISKHDTVLDASCGQGYGSFILSLHAGMVYGLDVNSGYLNKARKYYNKDNIKYYIYDDFYMSEDDFKADKIVCIETFEHINRDEIGSYISNLLKRLKPGGSMFLTAPLGHDRKSDYNPHHLNEPSINFLYDIFRNRFSKMNFRIDRFTNSYGYKTSYCYVILNNIKKM